VICPNNQICKLCFKGGYHDQHQFVVRQGPEKDWEPAYRDTKLAGMDEEQSRAMQQEVLKKLEDKNISTEDYELLIHLQSNQNKLTLPEFCALAYQKEFKNPNNYDQLGQLSCFVCSMEIQDALFGIQMNNCQHNVHKTCLPDAIIDDNEVDSNKCRTCKRVILNGLEEALKIPKIVVNKVTVKVNQSKEK
jgi:hypothetical protein